ncbi:hypothetical protein JKP88DRAFT_241070 [Tribonema minus]|uniref:Uncharacterized protein n=1 Tax=Tribonema minus TaxID=303371 RepID=A0A836CHS4_9STRA|nr:hypothetical protein JKP88DRAFT_241070 [Tribonema minus]
MSTDTCPIGLEAITTRFVHDKIAFEAKEMFKYIRQNPNARNPVTRAEIKDEDVTALNQVVESARPLPIGRARLLASEEQVERDEMIAYLRDEVVAVVTETLELWHSPLISDINFYTSLGSCVANLMNMRRDMIVAGGLEEWTFIIGTLRKDYTCSLARELFDFLDKTINDMGRSVPPYSERSPLVMATPRHSAKRRVKTPKKTKSPRKRVARATPKRRSQRHKPTTSFLAVGPPMAQRQVVQKAEEPKPLMKSILKLPALDSRGAIDYEFGREKGKPLDKEDLLFFKPDRVPLKDYIAEVGEALTIERRRR